MSWSDTWTFIMDCLRDFFRGPPEAEMPRSTPEKKHRFHHCRTENDRWAALAEVLEVLLEQSEAIRKRVASNGLKLDRILAIIKAPGDTGAALTELADDVDAVKDGLKKSVDDNTPPADDGNTPAGS